MNADLDALATRLYVTIDDLLDDHPEWRPERPKIGIAPQLSDAELITLAVIQALLGYTSERRFIRYAKTNLKPWFPYLPQRAAYNKRLRAAGSTIQHIISALARDCPSYSDDLWLVDSTPVECGRSRETTKRSDMAGHASYGYCASHSRWFWGLRLHLIATTSGLPIAYALTSANTDERNTTLAMLSLDPDLMNRAGQTLMGDKGYRSAAFEIELNNAGITLIRPSLKSEKQRRPGEQLLKPFRQIIESINQTFKAQLDLERHGGRKPEGVCARVLQRILALTAAIWHNETSNHPGPARSLIAYDH
jgi:Transposase DDE domain